MVYLIIVGSRGVMYSVGNGHFHCPRCEESQPYERKRVRQFFTVFFVPIFPLGVAGEFVECGCCGSAYQPEVLDHDPEEQRKELEAEFERAIRRVLALMVLAEEDLLGDGVHSFQRVLSQLSGQPVSEDEIDVELAKSQHEAMDLEEFLGSVAPHLNDDGKELIVRAAVMVGAADGELTEAQQAVLSEVGQGLEMSPAHVRGVVAEALEAS